MSRQALGRGLESLIPMNGNVEDTPAGPRQELPIDLIAVNPFQPRKEFKAHELEELTASIQEKGIVQPVLVRPRPGGRFELVAGERRLRAAKLAGLAQIPVIIKELSDQDSLEIALIENIQRADLNPVDQAHAFHQLQSQFQLTQEEMAKKVGKDRSSVANTLRLLKLPPSVLEMVGTGQLSEGHARAILTLENEDAMHSLADKVIRDGLSVREAERLSQGGKPQTARTKHKTKGSAHAADKDPNIRTLEEDLKRRLATHVKVTPKTTQKGKIEIEYYSLDDLDRILSLIG